MRFVLVVVLGLVVPTTITAEEFLTRAAALQPQHDPVRTRETAGFVAVFAGIGLSVVAFDYSREVAVAGGPETRKEWVPTLRRPALLYVGVGTLASGLLMATVWKSTNDRVEVGPGSLAIRW